MHHESSIRAETRASPIVSPALSSATLSTQPWQDAAQPTESAQIANGLDRGEALQTRKRLLTSTAPPILVGLCPVPLASPSDTSALNQEGITPSPQQDLPVDSKRRRRLQAVEEAETDAIPTASPTRHDLTGADTMASPVPQGGVSWPRPRMQVGWEREGECGGADAPARQTLRVCLLPEVEQAHTYVRVCLSNQTGNAAVLRADRTASGCYVVDLTTLAERLGQPSLPIAARVRSPDGSLLCMALLHLQQGTAARTPLVRHQSLTAHSFLSLSLSPSLHTGAPPTDGP